MFSARNHGLAHLDKLQREIKVALYIRRVNDVYYRVRLALDYKIARYLLLAGYGRMEYMPGRSTRS